MAAGIDYTHLQGRAAAILGRAAQGSVQLVRAIDTGVPVSVGEPWRGNVVETETVALAATVSRVAQRYVNGTTIQATDDQITFAVPGFEPGMRDTFVVDGVTRTLVDLRRIPAAGVAVAYVAIVRG
jgi:hypothetical protein